MQKDSLKKNLCTAALSIALLCPFISSLEAYNIVPDEQIATLTFEQREQLAIQLLKDFLDTNNTDPDLSWDISIKYLLKLINGNPRYAPLYKTLENIQLVKSSWKILKQTKDKIANAYTIGKALKDHKKELPLEVQEIFDKKTTNQLVQIIAYRL